MRNFPFNYFMLRVNDTVTSALNAVIICMGEDVGALTQRRFDPVVIQGVFWVHIDLSYEK